ncbi:protein DGCR6-like [Choloepus didactylus]|uniref:protein DGCR6-like n=1 Tax=Choloepus didactylus TaxID=27675 RepID=UPI0018A04D3A|nr:protein DGCR6-like [Choloepus didactylus]
MGPSAVTSEGVEVSQRRPGAMERYVGVLEVAGDGTRQQERHYQLLLALQSLVKELPSSFQQRLFYTTLSDLDLALFDGTVFEIVQEFLEIQHLTEKSVEPVSSAAE